MPFGETIAVNPVELLRSIPPLLGKGFRYLAGLAKSGADILADEAGTLRAIRHHVETAVSAQESTELKTRKPQVTQWMNEVDDLLNEVKMFRDSRVHSIPCLKDCPCWTTDMLQRVRRLKADGEGLNGLLGEEPLSKTNEVPNPPIVGGEETLSEIRRLLDPKSDVKIIGIYGMPGIGKTTLLQKIYHELKSSNQEVAYAKVSKEPNILNIQKDIARELRLPLVEHGPSETSSRKSQQANILLNKLSNGNAILLLDDVWEPPKWDEIGIPCPDVHQAACKIVFTTPFRQVCLDMHAGAGTIKVGYLGVEEAWSLFCQKVKKAEDDPSIAPAKQVILSRCGGLPRAVIAMSNHMACSAPNGEYKTMIEKLKHSPHEISGMKNEVLRPLKCIFDKLEEKEKEIAVEMRQCLLYCSLFPEDQSIDIDQLIDYWVGEGFVDAEGCFKLPSARDTGHEIVSTLMNECFLENTHKDDHKEVKLHDVVRGMALWLTDGVSEQSRLFLTSSRLKGCNNRRWEKAERISSMDNCDKVFPSNILKCSHLLTVLYNNYSIQLKDRRHSPIQGHHLNHCTSGTASTHHELSNIREKPGNLFKYAQTLKVLDLSGTKIENLPREIGSLEELQYLNVSYTNIKELPKELSRLKKLRQLKLRCTHHLSNIPSRSFPEPTILQMLDLFCSRYCWGPSSFWRPSPIKVEDLSKWNYLDEIGLTITSSSSLESLCSTNLVMSTVFLKLQDVEGLREGHLFSIFNNMKNLRELSISGINLPNLEIITGQLPKLEFLGLCNSTFLSIIVVIEDAGLLQSLRHVHISDCPRLTEITWVHRLPCLVEISLSNCRGVEELVAGQEAQNPYSLSKKLREIHLRELPNLRRTARHPLNSPSLEIISVTGCPSFKRLSLDTETARNIQKITGEGHWWNGLQWDHHDSTKLILQNRFTEVPLR